TLWARSRYYKLVGVKDIFEQGQVAVLYDEAAQFVEGASARDEQVTLGALLRALKRAEDDIRAELPYGSSLRHPGWQKCVSRHVNSVGLISIQLGGCGCDSKPRTTQENLEELACRVTKKMLSPWGSVHFRLKKLLLLLGMERG